MAEDMNTKKDFGANQKIAIIDDEEMVTNSIKSFLQLETDYQVFTFQSPEIALVELQQIPPDLVISDFLMPEMNGIEFLCKLKELYPEIPSILLTAYADKENSIKAINDVGLFQFVEKPWDNDQLLLIIRNGLAATNLKSQLREKIHQLDEINRQKEELFKINNLLNKELSLARRVHEKILPPTEMKMEKLSILVKYLPAFEIGGDFYDFFELSEGKFLITLADLTGHGIQAALCTALLKFALATNNTKNHSLEQIMNGINDILYRGLPSDIFAAVLLIGVDVEKNLCEMLNGGIPYPILFRQKDRKAVPIIISGLVPGMVSNENFECGDHVKIDLKQGDRLFVFTDGLSEIQNSDGILFGEESLSHVINNSQHMTIKEVANQLFQEALNYNDKKKQLDDLTLICIELG
jgi:serine phosphatase RsbU (regulator of sigma subunit)